MFTITLSDFMIELKEGTIRNVGGPTKAATAKLFGVSSAHARPFGNDRVKLLFEDDDGNEVQIALFREEVATIVRELEELEPVDGDPD